MPDNDFIHITIGNDIDLTKKFMQLIRELYRK